MFRSILFTSREKATKGNLEKLKLPIIKKHVELFHRVLKSVAEDKDLVEKVKEPRVQKYCSDRLIK